MDYYGLLFLYYLKGLSGKSILRLFFNIEAGGTELLLPENTSTPTTTPILADIQYPDGLRTDQYFTYRETPTTVSNKARIKTIKGNTLVWNQLVQNGNFADTSNWRAEYNATISASNNVLSLTPTEQNGRVSQIFTYKENHKLLIMADVKLSSTLGTLDNVTLSAYAIDNRAQVSTSHPIASTDWQKLYVFCYSASSNANNRFMFTDGRTSDWGTTQIRNYVAFDLTSMFGETKANELFASEQSQVGKGLLEFTSLFSLPYYSYNQGSLLSFNGNGIKTVGKNQIKLSADTLVSSQRIGINYLDNGAVFTANGTYSRAGYTCKTIKGQQYTLSFKGFSDANFGAVYISNDLDWSTKYGRIILGSTETNQSLTFTADSELLFVGFYLTNTGTSGSMTIKDIQLELGSSVTSYEPYASSTTNLPVSTYFPTGMKSAGSVYDELTESKAITRIGAVDLGSLDWEILGTVGVSHLFLARAGVNSANDNIQQCDRNIKISSSKYTPVASWNSISMDKSNMAYGVYETQVRISDSNYTTIETFKASLSGVYLNYELATPTETPITTEDANEALSLLMGKSVSSNNANQLINIITKGE